VSSVCPSVCLSVVQLNLVALAVCVTHSLLWLHCAGVIRCSFGQITLASCLSFDHCLFRFVFDMAVCVFVMWVYYVQMIESIIMWPSPDRSHCSFLTPNMNQIARGDPSHWLRQMSNVNNTLWVHYSHSCMAVSGECDQTSIGLHVSDSWASCSTYL